jgi:uncharacterized membrane protein YraQ (UPF0718 family)
MDVGTLFLAALAAGLFIYAVRRPGDEHRQGLAIAGGQLIRFLPRIAVALITAGFFAKLVPSEFIAPLIGEESGFTGIAVASLAGGFVPGGPIISFPVVVVLYKAGAGVPQLVAFLTAWSVFAFHRVLIYESTLMGWQFSARRLLASLILPPLAGLAAELLLTLSQLV